MRPLMLKRYLTIAIVSVSVIVSGLLFINMSKVDRGNDSVTHPPRSRGTASIGKIYRELRQLKAQRSQFSGEALKVLEVHQQVVVNYLSARLRIKTCEQLMALDPELPFGSYTFHGESGFFKAECGIKK